MNYGNTVLENFILDEVDSIRDFQLKKYPKILLWCGHKKPANNIRRDQMPIPQDWIIFFVEL